LLLFISEEILLDVAVMYVDLFKVFSNERVEFLINALIDKVVPVLLFRIKKVIKTDVLMNILVDAAGTEITNEN
jgi:hypothetical protein